MKTHDLPLERLNHLEKMCHSQRANYPGNEDIAILMMNTKDIIQIIEEVKRRRLTDSETSA